MIADAMVHLRVEIMQRVLGVAVLIKRGRRRRHRIITRLGGIAESAIVALALHVGERVGEAEIQIRRHHLLPRHAAAMITRLQGLRDVRQMRRQTERVAAATILPRVLVVCAHLCPLRGRHPNLKTADQKLLFRDLAKPVRVEIDGVVLLALRDHGDGHLAIGLRDIRPCFDRPHRHVLLQLDATLHKTARAHRLERHEIHHAPHRARAIERRTAALHHLDPIHKRRRYLLDSIYPAERGQQRRAIEKDLIVSAPQPEQLHLGRVAILAIALDPHPVEQLDRLRKIRRRTQLDVLAQNHLGAHRHLVQQALGSRARRHHQRLQCHRPLALGRARHARRIHRARRRGGAERRNAQHVHETINFSFN